MAIRFRRGQVADIPHCKHLIQCERPLLSPMNWERLPSLLADLLSRHRLTLVVVEEPASGRYRMLGGSAFLDAAFLARALEHPEASILEQALSAETAGGAVFLSPRRIAEENGKGELRLLNFIGVPDFSGLDGPEGNLMFATINEAWRFHHYGYQLREFYAETTHPQMAEFMRGMQTQLVRERKMWNQEVAETFRFTRQDAIEKTGGNISFMFIAPLPRFGFSIAEQRLLEMVLMDYSDREISETLDVTADAIKKRWRSIYDRVREVAPALMASGTSGPDQRRQFLQYLRQHLEELRPYQAPNQAP